MRLDTYLSPAALTPSALAGAVVAVIDVLRASTTIAAALEAGARSVIPFLETEDAVRTARQFEKGEVLLAGERHMRPIDGFDLGNSPREFVAERVQGRTVLLTTTNGTRALHAAHDAQAIFVASFVNATVTVGALADALAQGQRVAFVCAAHDGLFSLEDATLAGRLAEALATRVGDVATDDATRTCRLLHARYGDDTARLFAEAEHGRALVAAGYAHDLADCGAIDAHPILCRYRDHVILGSPATVSLGTAADA